MKSRAVRFLLGGALIALVMLIAVLPSSTPGQTPASPLASSSFNAIAPDVDQSRERFMPEPGEDESQESANLLALGDYFYHRLSYPTGQFDSSWYLEAKAQDDRIERGEGCGKTDRIAGLPEACHGKDRETGVGDRPGVALVGKPGYVVDRVDIVTESEICLLYTSPSPRDS